MEEKTKKKDKEGLINCLRNERITVKHLNRRRGSIDDPRHILYGGMAEGATKTFTVPRLSSGTFKNVLTNEEKAYLEEALGLEYNALSIHKAYDNFWDDSNPKGINKVVLTKQDNIFNLADPVDYIKYKILLANKNYIAPSIKELQDRPKVTYEFVIIEDNEDVKSSRDSMTATMKCYKEFGKVENDIDTLKTIIETIDGRPLSKNTKIEFLQTKINDLIQGNAKTFLKVITDEYLPTKVLIKKCIAKGLIVNRGDYLYIKSDNTPLCGEGQNPTISVAAQFLNMPKNQELKFALEAKLKD